MSNLYLSMLDRMGVAGVPRHGDSTGRSWKGSEEEISDRTPTRQSPPPPRRICTDGDVDQRLGDLGQLLVGGALLIQGLAWRIVRAPLPGRAAAA